MEKIKSASRSKKSASARQNGGSPLKEFFIEELKDIYWAEKHLMKALPKMQKASTSEQLADAFSGHLTQTEEHVKRLEQIFEMLEEKPRAKKCEGMEGIVKEGESVIEETEKNTATRDAGLIIAAQKAEHYEITAYGSLVELAKTIGKQEVSDILTQTLEEEKETDKLLTEIATTNINQMAEEESEGVGSENDEEME